MATTIRIDVPDDDQYERLSRVKEQHGLTWRGMLLRAAESLEDE